MSYIQKMLLSLLLFFLLKTMVLASAGTHAMPFVDMIGIPAAKSLGNSVTAVNGYQSVFVNPAGLAKTNKRLVSAQLFSYVEDITYKQILLTDQYALGSMALSVTWLDYGSYNATTINDQFGQSSGTTSSHSSCVHLAYAKNQETFSWGLSGKYLTETLAGYSASAMALDIGVQTTLNPFIKVGLSSTNIGLSKIKYIKNSAAIRRVDRIGVHVTSIDGWSLFEVMGDVLLVDSRDLNYSIGSIVNIHETLDLRVGIETISDLFEFNFGAQFQSEFIGIELAYQPNKDFVDVYRLSVSLSY